MWGALEYKHGGYSLQALFCSTVFHNLYTQGSLSLLFYVACVCIVDHVIDHAFCAVLFMSRLRARCPIASFSMCAAIGLLMLCLHACSIVSSIDSEKVPKAQSE
jgi:hypothetical protein